MIAAENFVAGTPGVLPEQVTQLFVPGRGRADDGIELSEASAARFEYAADFFVTHNLLERGGQIVCSGYKTPRDFNGEPWVDPTTGIVYQGVPEAISGASILLGRGIPAECIKVEPNAVDSPGNFVLGRKLLRPGEATGVVAQAGHLERMLNQIAARTISQPYVGLVVPETPNPDHDSPIAAAHSAYILRGMTPDNPDLQAITEARSARAWRVVLAAEALVKLLRKAPSR
ncbi:MAG TPA: hypothetical protein VLH86_03365 [Patescibacteria group bacterium]|nr:hypothetical protein [Patescibacteria group bacterium]